MSYYLARSLYNLYISTNDPSYLEGVIELLKDSNIIREIFLLYKAYLALNERELANQIYFNLPHEYREFIQAFNIEDDYEKFERLYNLIDYNIEVVDYYIIMINLALILGREDILEKIKEMALKNLIDDEKEWVKEFIELLYNFKSLYDGEALEIILDENFKIINIEDIKIDDWIRMFLSIGVYKASGKYRIILPRKKELYELGLELLYGAGKINQKLFEVLINV